MKQAVTFSRTGLQAGLLDGKTHRAPFAESLITTANNAMNNNLSGLSYGLYMVTKNEKFKDMADGYSSLVSPVWEKYGFAGDSVLGSIQPLGSTARYVGVNLAIQAPLTLLGYAFGPTGAKVMSLVGRGLAAGVNFSLTGLSEAGNNFYEMSKITVPYGNTLDLDSPLATGMFWTNVILSGAIETVGSEMLPGVRMLQSSISPAGLRQALFTGWKDFATQFGVGTGLSMFGEGFEEFEGALVSGVTTNILKTIANEKGGRFDLEPMRKIVDRGLTEALEAGKDMIIPSLVSGLFGGGVYGVRTRFDARQNFTQTKESASAPMNLIQDIRETIGEKTATTSTPDSGSSGKKTKISPIRVYESGNRLIPINAEESEKYAQAQALGAKSAEIIIQDIPQADGNTQAEQINTMALHFGSRISGNTLVFESQEDYEAAKDTISRMALESRGDEYDIVAGESKVTLSLAMDDGQMESTEPDASYLPKVDIPFPLSTMSADRAIQTREREMIEEAIGDLVTHTEGRISRSDMDANVDAVLAVGQALKMNTDDLLKNHLTFTLDTEIPAPQKGKVALGFLERPSLVNGKPVYTVHISKKADASTLPHEVLHFMRPLVPKELMAPFVKAYGGTEGEMWLEDIKERDGKFYLGKKEFSTYEEAAEAVRPFEERFAEDGTGYLGRGIAPIEEMKPFFERFKAALKALVEKFKDRLSADVVKAFDRLFSEDGTAENRAGRAVELFQQESSLTPQEAQRQYTEVENRYRGTDLWMKAPNGKPTNLTERQWVTVRTTAFKNWFGDWEAAENFKWLMNAEPVSTITGEEFKENLVDNVAAFFGKIGNKVVREGVGEITLTRRDIQASVAHGIGRKKASAFAAVPAVIQNGREFNRIENYKGRGYTAITIDAPIVIGDEQYICEVVINQQENSRHFYLHEVEIKEKLQFGNQVRSYMDGNHPNRNTKTEASETIIAKVSSQSKSDSSHTEVAIKKKLSDEPLQDTSFKGDSSTPASRLIVTKLLYQGTFDSSQVVDENSEPLVAYHATDNESTPLQSGNSAGTIYLGFDEKSAKRVAHGKRDVIPVFLSVKNPVNEMSSGIEQHDAESPQKVAQWRDAGHDGVYVHDESGTGIAVFDPGQIKSATDNVGTFNATNPSILFQTEDFSPEYAEFSGKPQEAIDHLLEVKQGSVPAAMYKEGIGDIDFVYGKPGETGYGLAHIQEKHPNILPRLVELIETGVVSAPSKDRRNILLLEARAAIRLDWNGEKKNWLVTAYYYDNHLSGSTGIDAAPGMTSGSGQVQTDRLSTTINESDVPVNDSPSYQLSAEAKEDFPNALFQTASVRMDVPFNENEGGESRVYALAEESRTEFSDTVRAMAAAFRLPDDAVMFRRDLKGVERARVKVAQDYGGDWGRLLDINGAMLVFEEYDDAKSSFERFIAEHPEKVARQKIKDDDFGYRDFTVNIRMSNGFIGEVQLLDKVIFHAKETGGHEIYAEARKLTKYYENREKYTSIFGSEIIESIRKLYDDLKEWSREVYSPQSILSPTASYDKPGLSAKASASLRESRELSSMLRPYIPRSLSVGALSMTDVPSSEGASTALRNTPLSSVLMGISQISKYLTAIESSSSLSIPNSQESDKISGDGGAALYQLSDEAKEEILNQRENDVQHALGGNYYVPTSVVDEYAAQGKEWAVKEMNLRSMINASPELLKRAREYQTSEDFMEAMKNDPKVYDRDFVDEHVTPEDWMDADEYFFGKVYAYAHLKSRDQRDRLFVNKYLSSDKKLLELVTSLRVYSDVDTKYFPKRRKPVYTFVRARFGAFPGVSPYVLRLKESSSPEEFARARQAIMNNPRAYRNALLVVEQANYRVATRITNSEDGNNAYATANDVAAYLEEVGEDVENELFGTHYADEPLVESVDMKPADGPVTQTQIDAMEADSRIILDRYMVQEAKDKAGLQRQIKTVRKRAEDAKSKAREISRELTAQKKKNQRIGELRAALKESRAEEKKQTAILTALQRKLEAHRLKEARAHLFGEIKKSTTWNENTMDAAYIDDMQMLQAMVDPKNRSRKQIKDWRKDGDVGAVPEHLSQYVGASAGMFLIY
ncbi:hypothetical protein Spico_1440 [Parasphaerochaeta coccoides DSM 17374]|uniref:Uncharacterized protein n=2 Tax=Parasphaerochaeta TaxID=3062336 RepID=F4GI46_PARC1|nr:hypothetical protein Spico_1440 [Parasphaerochaeta coccoides DSM 17374]